MSNGQCISVYDCPYVLNWLRRAKTDEEKRQIRSLQCNYKGGGVEVCCPLDDVPAVRNPEITGTNFVEY